MPLFGSKKETTPPPPPETVSTTTHHRTSPNRSSGFFSRRKSDSPDRHSTVTTTSHTSSPHRTPSKLSHGSGGLLHRNHEDPSIVNARERVVKAEAAEREADRALIAARGAVREAIAHVRTLEAEAAEEARLAKIKQGQAASLSKRGKMLGRHDHH